MGYFSVLDFVIVAVYAVMIIGLGFFFSRSKGKEKSTEDYFLAGKSLPWWAIGASLIAANISAEQYIGMSGSGFASGLAIASYEFMSALTLIIVGKFFLPIFIKQGIYTIPEFVEKRFKLFHLSFKDYNLDSSSVLNHIDEIIKGSTVKERDLNEYLDSLVSLEFEKENIILKNPDIFKNKKKKFIVFKYEDFMYLKPGNFFGESALHGIVNKRNASIRAEEDCVVLSLFCLQKYTKN